MFYGVAKNKLNLANAQCEDSLTSSVFERLSLLSDENLWWVLRNACDKQALAAKPLPEDVGKLEKFEFWPRWKADTQLERNSKYVEPDVFLRFEGIDIIVEAKRYDFVKSQQESQRESQREEQWQNELGAWLQEFKDKFKKGRLVLLLAIGGNINVGTYKEMELKHLSQFREFCEFRVEQLHWGMLCDAVFELSNRFSNDTQLVHLFDQLDMVFEFFGVGTLKMRWFCDLRSITMENDSVNPSQLSSALADVRKAYRVLVPFQEMMKNTLLYIQEQYRFNNNKDWDIWLYPCGAFANSVIRKIGLKPIEVIFNKNTSCQNISFVGYSIVWFGGPDKFSENKVAELWGFIVLDDRLIINSLRDVDDIVSVQDAESAIGYIVLFAAVKDTNRLSNKVLWLVENDRDEGLKKICELLSSPSDEKIKIMSNEKGDEMRDFAKLVLEEGKVKIFKDRFYSEN